MPPLPPAPGVVEVQLVHELNADNNVYTRLFNEFSGATPTVAQLATMASTLSGNWNTLLKPYAPADCVLREIVVTDLTSSSSSRGLWTGSITGTRSGTANPGLLCALVNYAIARRYRGGKPRSYLPYGTQSDLNGAAGWTSGFVSGLTTAWTDFIADVATAIGVWGTAGAQCAVSYYEGFASVENPVTKRWRNIPTPRSGDAVVDPILSLTIASNYSQQRRRQKVIG